MAKFIVNDMRSEVKVRDGQALLDPQILQQIIPLCVRAVKEDLARDQRMEQARRLTGGIRSEE
jgi:hypothetical protein